jgi:hypothetical protein
LKQARLAATLVALTVAGSAVAAQSLDDLARAEQRRRAAQGRAGKVYTDADLRPDPTTPTAPRTAPVVAPPSAATPAAPPAEAAITPASADAADPDAARLAEARWRTRARELRSILGAARDRVEALAARLKDLDAQLQAGYSASVTRERDVTARSSVQAQGDLRALDEELQRFERNARSEKVPADWIQ